MKSKINKYNNENRLVKAEDTKHKIIQAAGRLWLKYSLKDISLNMIAEEAGVTTRTILRKFGSKEGLFNESLSYNPAEIPSKRASAVVGDLESILTTLLANYEEIEEAAIQTISLETEMEIAKQIGEQARTFHKEWCAEVFGPFLPGPESNEYEIYLSSYIAATEFYLWKLLRKDMKLSKKKTYAVFRNMLEGLILKHSME